jgi:hypothetical protein
VLGSITGLLLILLLVLFRKRFVNQRNSTLSKASSSAFLFSLYSILSDIYKMQVFLGRFP